MLDRLVDLFISFLDLFQCWFIVQPYEQAVVVFLGRHLRVRGPGIHWRAPFRMDHVFCDSVVTRSIETSPQSLTTSDGRSVVVEAEILCKTSDIQSFYVELNASDGVIADFVKGKIGEYVRSQTWDEIRSDDRAPEHIATTCKNYLTRRGVTLEALILGNFVAARSYRLWETSSGGITMD